MRWLLTVLLLLGACSGPSSEAYVFRPKKQLRLNKRADLKAAMQSGYWLVESSEHLSWYDFREDDQCTINWVEDEGVLREIYCIWFLHDKVGKKEARLDLVIPSLSTVVFSDTIYLGRGVIRIKDKPDILRHSATYPMTTMPTN